MVSFQLRVETRRLCDFGLEVRVVETKQLILPMSGGVVELRDDVDRGNSQRK